MMMMMMILTSQLTDWQETEEETKQRLSKHVIKGW